MGIVVPSQPMECCWSALDVCVYCVPRTRGRFVCRLESSQTGESLHNTRRTEEERRGRGPSVGLVCFVEDREGQLARSARGGGVAIKLALGFVLADRQELIDRVVAQQGLHCGVGSQRCVPGQRTAPGYCSLSF